LVFEADVTAVSESEWSTKLTINGTYDAPKDIVSVKDYQIIWTTDGETLFEEGAATLVLASGKSVLSKWSSSITAKGKDFSKFPAEGEIVVVSYSPFSIEGNRMSYEWKGTVSRRAKER